MGIDSYCDYICKLARKSDDTISTQQDIITFGNEIGTHALSNHFRRIHPEQFSNQSYDYGLFDGDIATQLHLNVPMDDRSDRKVCTPETMTPVANGEEKKEEQQHARTRILLQRPWVGMSFD